MMLIEVTVRSIDGPRSESRSTHVYTVPLTEIPEWQIVQGLNAYLHTIAQPLMVHGPVEVFEDGHELWDILYNEHQEFRWCAEHERWEVAS